MTAHERLALVADEGSLTPWNENVVSTDRLEFSDTRPYRDRLMSATDAAGRSEAVLTGQVTLHGQRSS
jgi:acetyl-CoA carboxylase beta subunit